MAEEKKQCAFCGATEDDRQKRFIASMYEGIYICDECVEICGEYLKGFKKAKTAAKKKKIEIKTPAEIKAVLDEYVIGQDEAKIMLSVAVYNHYKRVFQSPTKRTRMWRYRNQTSLFSDRREAEKRLWRRYLQKR